MELLFSRRHTATLYVKLDTTQCRACWKCLEACPNNVIGKVDLPWHKHALIKKPDACTGCQKCLMICRYGAYALRKQMIYP